MIIFKKIRFKNFLSTGNSFTEYSLNTHNTMLVVGMNGSGKSTLLDALSFALFGRPFRKINKPQLVNAIINKNCLAEVEFSIGTKEYLVRRGITPAIFEVFQDGILLNQVAATKDYQETLEKDILKTTHKSFCQVVILGAATFKPFMRLTAGERREVIEDLLDLQIFTSMNIVNKANIAVSENLIVKKENEKKLLEMKLKLLKKGQKLLIEEKIKRRGDLRDETALLASELERSEGQMTWLKAQLVGEAIINRKVERYWRLEHNITANRDQLLDTIKFLESNDTCPNCAQIIEHDFKHSEIALKKARVQECEEGLIELKKKQDELALQLKEFTNIKENIYAYKLDIEITRTQITSNTQAVQKLDEELAELTEPEDVSETEKALADILEEINSIEKKMALMNVASILLKDGGIKAEIIKKYVPLINKYINKYLAEFELPCRFMIDETFNETISWSSRKNIFSYESFSTGERQGIDLSILFAWRAITKMRNTLNTNLLILDEVFDTYQDYMAVDFLMTIIHNFAQENNVIVITHKDQMLDKFEHIVKVEKYRNFSRICKA